MTDNNINIDEKLNKLDLSNDISTNEESDSISKKEQKKLIKQQYKEQKKQEKKLNKKPIEAVPEVIEEKINFPEPKTDREAYQIEVKHVREIYDKIALHFDSTRYKAWPIVEKFLLSRDTGSIGIDVGCGNGKYLGVNTNTHLIGSDICNNFASICNEKHYESLVADNLFLPYQSSSFDFSISIAVIHHFSTFERRVEAVREIIRVLKPNAILLITSWATTQKWKGKSYQEQDVMVPWLFQNQFNPNNNIQPQQSPQESSSKSTVVDTTTKSGSSYEVYHRYYHLFEQGEFEKIIGQISECELVENNLDHDNYYCFIKKK